MGLTDPQPVTVAFLESEIAALRADHPDRGWREWELALAREHYRLTPEIPFVRQVPRPAPKRRRRAGSRDAAINLHAVSTRSQIMTTTDNDEATLKYLDEQAS
jgi:hypothetical protein